MFIVFIKHLEKCDVTGEENIPITGQHNVCYRISVQHYIYNVYIFDYILSYNPIHILLVRMTWLMTM